jgi:hypothetical protein
VVSKPILVGMHYWAVRTKVINLIAMAPMFIVYSIFAAAISTDGQLSVGFKIVMWIPVALFLALMVRTICAFDIKVDDTGLTYRTTFRNYRFEKDRIGSFSLEEGRSTAGFSNLLMVNMNFHDATTRALKLFSCFRPTPESPTPNGFQRMKTMTAELNEWLGSGEPALTSDGIGTGTP